MKNRRLLSVAAPALACLTACSGAGSSAQSDDRMHVSADYAQYASAEEVTTVADIAITGPVLSVQTKECDQGGETSTEPAIDPTAADSTDPSPDPSATSSPDPTVTPSGIAGDGPGGGAQCMPMVFLKVRVASMMKRGFGVSEGDEIVIGNIDTDAVSMEGTTPLTVGKQYALYLTRLAAGDHPGITSVPTFWIPVGGNQGIFIVGKGTVQPASANIVALTEADAEKKLAAGAGGASRPARLSTTVEGLKKAASAAAARKRTATRHGASPTG